MPLRGPDGHVVALAEVEGAAIRHAIRHYRGQMTEVARRLKIGRSTLYRRLKELGLDADSLAAETEPGRGGGRGPMRRAWCRRNTSGKKPG